MDADATKATQVSDTILHALIALFKAGLRSTHCKLADMLMECDTPSMKTYIKVKNNLGHYYPAKLTI